MAITVKEMSEHAGLKLDGGVIGGISKQLLTKASLKGKRVGTKDLKYQDAYKRWQVKQVKAYPDEMYQDFLEIVKQRGYTVVAQAQSLKKSEDSGVYRNGFKYVSTDSLDLYVSEHKLVYGSLRGMARMLGINISALAWRITQLKPKGILERIVDTSQGMFKVKLHPIEYFLDVAQALKPEVATEVLFYQRSLEDQPEIQMAFQNATYRSASFRPKDHRLTSFPIYLPEDKQEEYASIQQISDLIDTPQLEFLQYLFVTQSKTETFFDIYDEEIYDLVPISLAIDYLWASADNGNEKALRIAQTLTLPCDKENLSVAA